MFLTEVTRHIRSKEARAHVEKELAHHLEETTKTLMKSGLSQAEAERQAMERMGSAAQLGKSMNRLYKPKWDFWLIGALVLLLVASFLPLISINYEPLFGADMTSNFVSRQVLFIILAIVIIGILTFLDVRKMWHYRFLIYGIGLSIALLLNVAPNISYKGEPLFKIGFMTINMWMTLPFFVVGMAAFFATKRFKWLPFIGIFIATVLLFFYTPNLSVLFLYIGVVAVLFTASHFTRRTKQVVWGIVGIGILVLSSYLYYLYNYTDQKYQLSRIHAFLHPEMYEGDYGYDMILLNSVMYEAGWFGKETITPFSEAHTVYALVQIVQAYGYSVALPIVMVILFICGRIFWTTRTLPASFGRNIVLGAMTLYSMQSIYSLLMICGVVPLTDMPLPFISYGETPMMLNAALIGLVMSVYRRKSFYTTQKASL